jgi:hypothetical protein
MPAEETTTPRSALEEQVAAVWKSVLGVPAVGVHQNFFDVGGNSLLLYRVYSHLRAIRGDLNVVDLFRHTTVETLAAYLAGRDPRARADLAKSRRRGEERRVARAAARRTRPTSVATGENARKPSLAS